MLRTRLIAGPWAGFVLSAVAATLLASIQVGSGFFEPLRVVADEPAPVTLRLDRATSADLSGQGVTAHHGLVLERNTEASDPVTRDVIERVSSKNASDHLETLLGLWLMDLLLLLGLTAYIRKFCGGQGRLMRTQAGLLGVIVCFMAVAKLVLSLTPYSLYLIPVATVPIWMAGYVERRTALMVALVCSVLTVSLASFDLAPMLVLTAGSFAAVLALQEDTRPLALFIGGAISGLAAATFTLASTMLLHGGVPDGGLGSFEAVRVDLRTPIRSDILAALAGGLMSGLLGALAASAIGRVLGLVSKGRLLDLADLQQPLLQKMAAEAPGSWEHSRAMANLAEAAASSINADALLTRVGAYYHDLGKSCQPKYFIENLEKDEVSPHDTISPEVSADAIMAHVVQGVRILRSGGIPEPVIEFSYTHHGTSVIAFFWGRCQHNGNPAGLTEAHFRYPGMKPHTRETAILMLVDAIEAASRTVEPERDRFQELVERITFDKLQQGQLDASGLTMRELRIVSNQLVDTLCKSHHTRIRYPWQEQADRERAEKDPGEGAQPDARQEAPPVPPAPLAAAPEIDTDALASESGLAAHPSLQPGRTGSPPLPSAEAAADTSRLAQAVENTGFEPDSAAPSNAPDAAPPLELVDEPSAARRGSIPPGAQGAPPANGGSGHPGRNGSPAPARINAPAGHESSPAVPGAASDSLPPPELTARPNESRGQSTNAPRRPPR